MSYFLNLVYAEAHYPLSADELAACDSDYDPIADALAENEEDEESDD